MDHYKDPDYASYNSALELNEEEDKKENLSKLTKIIEEEYNREIMQRQEQIEQIELQICKVRKLLHLLRYALIMSYYKKKELEFSGTEDEASASESLVTFDKQNRIHPAIKKLLGKNCNNLDQITRKDKRKSHSRASDTNKTETNPTSDVKRMKLEVDPLMGPVEKRDEITTLATTPNESRHNSYEFVRNRKKTKYRIVVGNISKWLPSSGDDVLTHKWMVYVRGPKDKPDVSHFVDKVVFYLHPSFKPHDVVEISESPFHLSRRGWGEFPVRVQIYFKVTLNKPIDIVHNLKLDKTYTGRQTLGNETLIDVFLYDENNEQTNEEHETTTIETKDDSNEPTPTKDIKIELIELEPEEATIEEETIVEHDYCFGGTNTEDEISPAPDHSYCLTSFDLVLEKTNPEDVVQDETNSLIHGLDHSYLDDFNSEIVNHKPTSKIVISRNQLNQLIQLNRKDVKFNNAKILVFGKKIGGELLANFTNLVQSPKVISLVNLPVSNRNEVANFRISLPKNKFKNMGEALPYLFKRLPLWSDKASNINYKRLYPFTAHTLKEFLSWNIGKRRSSEWSRARIIRSLLISENIHGVKNWTTKAILMYGRSHDYTPFISYGLFHRDSLEKKLLVLCYSDSDGCFRNNSWKSIVEEEPEITVNVDSDIDMATSPRRPSGPMIDVSDPHLKMECSFIRQTALESGVLLKSEEIEEGVKVNGSEVMIFTAIKCLAENLIRRAKNHRVCTKTLSSNLSAISREDVEIAISERPEMLALQRFSRRRSMEYFS